MKMVPPASISQVVSSFFQNTRYHPGVAITGMNFAAARLTKEQKTAIIYPEGMVPLNVYIIYQIDEVDGYRIQLVSFAQKDGYIYGIYYILPDMAAFPAGELESSRHRIRLYGRMVPIDYFELYVMVKSTPVILAISNDHPTASLEFGRHARYFSGNVDANGIVVVNPKITRLGLSRTLRVV